ncbi:TPM domain-containing protein [Actinoplanes sp. NPDC049316]|uniref:TPM domain-containing protein n=1 Tax=Actinoplanes sp. NPDC049316 TaxID=3154727 RepID=UPI003445470B
MRSRARVAAFTLAAVAVLSWAAPAAAAPAYPKPSGRCVDETGVIGDDRCTMITRALLRDEKATSDEIAVAIVPTTGDKSIEAWSTGLFNSWGVGKKDKNNGVLLVVAVDDHRVRLETGRGVTKRLTDREAKAIVDDVVTPRFAEEDYLHGVLAGLDEVRRELGHSIPADALLETLGEPADDEEQFSPAYIVDDADSGDDGSGSAWGVVIVVVAGIGLLLALVTRASRGGSPGWARSVTRSGSAHHTAWVGGSTDTSASSFGSSSGSSFGGGSSDGGSGASGSW